jgi:hypothetical protein
MIQDNEALLPQLPPSLNDSNHVHCERENKKFKFSYSFHLDRSNKSQRNELPTISQVKIYYFKIYPKMDRGMPATWGHVSIKREKKNFVKSIPRRRKNVCRGNLTSLLDTHTQEWDVWLRERAIFSFYTHFGVFFWVGWIRDFPPTNQPTKLNTELGYS